jgi:hypothetical protein
MPQSLANSDSLLGIEHEQLSDKVQEVHVDHIRLWYYFLRSMPLLNKATEVTLQDKPEDFASHGHPFDFA